MTDHKFSQQQLAAIKILAEALNDCKQLGIHISGLVDFEISVHQDAEGKDYASVS